MSSGETPQFEVKTTEKLPVGDLPSELKENLLDLLQLNRRDYFGIDEEDNGIEDLEAVGEQLFKAVSGCGRSVCGLTIDLVGAVRGEPLAIEFSCAPKSFESLEEAIEYGEQCAEARSTSRLTLAEILELN